MGDQRELLDQLVLPVSQEFLADPDQRDTKEQWDDMVCLDQLDQPERLETKDHMDHRDVPEIRDQTDQLDQLDPQDLQEVTDKLETKELLDQPEITVFQEQLDQLVLQDLQDHLVISATCCLAISGTQLMETKESLCTEANVRLMTRR